MHYFRCNSYVLAIGLLLAHPLGPDLGCFCHGNCISNCGSEARLEEMLDGIADPDLQNIVAESVWSCWEQGRPNYSPTTLLDEAWKAYLLAGRAAIRSGILNQIGASSETRIDEIALMQPFSSGTPGRTVASRR